jgi:hypothetical protein
MRDIHHRRGRRSRIETHKWVNVSYIEEYGCHKYSFYSVGVIDQGKTYAIKC